MQFCIVHNWPHQEGYRKVISCTTYMWRKRSIFGERQTWDLFRSPQKPIRNFLQLTLFNLCIRNRYCTSFWSLPTRRVWRVSNAANLTDFILWRKKGHSRGTSSVREASPPSVPCRATDGQDKILASSIIMLLVEAVKSSSSTSVSHSVTRTSCTWSSKIQKKYRAIINQKELNASCKHVHGHELESEWKIFHICD